MNYLQLKLETRGMVRKWIYSFMNKYGIPSSVMEDVLCQILLELKDSTTEEFIASLVKSEPEPITQEKENKE